MAFDEMLAERVRTVLKRRRGITERKMFGGLAFMVHGNMCCGVEKERLMARVGPEAYQDALGQKHTRPMDFTGRPLKGYVYVEPAGVRTDAALKKWVERTLAFARSLPKK